MNRVRIGMAFGILAFGGFSFPAASARAQAPGVVRGPVYYYSSGYNAGVSGRPAAAPAVAAPVYRRWSAPAQPSWRGRVSNASPSTYREFGTGRNLYLGKPWLPSSP